MGIIVSGLIFIDKNIKVSMGQRYTYPTRWEKNVVTILHIYGARAVFLLFCYPQDTEYE